MSILIAVIGVCFFAALALHVALAILAEVVATNAGAVAQIERASFCSLHNGGDYTLSVPRAGVAYSALIKTCKVGARDRQNG